MDIFPMLSGWQRITVKQPLYEQNYTTIYAEKEFVSVMGSKGWVFSVYVITNDPNLLLKVTIDDNQYVNTANNVNTLGNNYNHFSTPAYNVTINGISSYALRFGNDNEPIGFSNIFKVSMVPSNQSAGALLLEYSIEYILIENMNEMVNSFRNLYGISQTAPSPTQQLPQQPSQGGIPSSKIITETIDVK